VRGVGGDHRAGDLDRVQQRLDLGDLSGVVGHPKFGDHDGGVVAHRGEQSHVVGGVAVVGGPDGLAVQGQAGSPAVGGMRPAIH
jgi:hypothetical protein